MAAAKVSAAGRGDLAPGGVQPGDCVRGSTLQPREGTGDRTCGRVRTAARSCCRNFASRTLPLGRVGKEQCPAGRSPGQQGGVRGWGQVARDRKDPGVTQTPLPPRGSPDSDPAVVDLGFSFQGAPAGAEA